MRNNKRHYFKKKHDTIFLKTRLILLLNHAFFWKNITFFMVFIHVEIFIIIIYIVDSFELSIN